VASAARAFSMMSGEAVPTEPGAGPRLGVPAGWISGLDAPTQEAWRRVSDGVPEVHFLDRERLYQVGLTVLLVEAAVYHRRWAAECPEKYGADVIGHIRRGLAILAVDFDEALVAMADLRLEALRAMDGIDALILPATAIVAPLVEAGMEVREPMSRFTRPFNTTGQPVVTLPAPAQGLPVGIQVVGHTNSGAISAALWLERKWQSSSA
jgi:Asp-tRNA(Asn)/Glu-tRNA(Gln) amidotransferase A subunit family amidase